MIYEYICTCGAEFDRVLPVAEYQTPQFCECGKTAKRVISAPMLAFAQRECIYDSPVDGRAITSWAQRREDLARHGCQEYDPGMKQDYHRRIEKEQNQLERKLDATIEAEVDKMPTRKREMLQNELDGGATAVPVSGAAGRKTVVQTPVMRRGEA